MDNGTQGGSAGTAEQPQPTPGPTPEAGAPASSGSGQADWLKTAQSGGSAPKPETVSTAPGAAPQLQQQAPQTVPVPVTSLKRGGLLGVIDSIGDVLAGKTRPELGKDPDGNLYVKQHSLTHGEQWAKIAGEAMHGAAAGLAAGRGRGPGAAALGGIQAGQQDQEKQKQDAQEMDATARQSMLDNANNQMLRMKQAEEYWKAQRLQTEATQHDVEFAQGQEDRLMKAKATMLGTVAHPGDITGVLKVNPDLMKDLVQNHSLEFTQHYEDGKPAGFKVWKTGEGYRDTVVGSGAEFPTFNAITGQYDWHKASDPTTTQGQIDDYIAAAGAAGQKYRNEQTEAANKQAQTANLQSETSARDKALPGKIAETAATTAEKRANAAKVPSEIAKNWAETHAAEAKATDDALASGQGGEGGALVDMIGTGKMPVGRLSYLLARKPELMAAVAAKYPDFDGSKVEQYVKAYTDFTSGATSKKLNSGATAMGHMRELMALNTPMSHIPHTPAWTAYQNKVDTLSTELAQFYGDTTIPAIEGIRKTLGSTLPGNRSSAIKTQFQSMSDKWDNYEQQWKNAAPSTAYEAQMPQMSEKAQEARAEFDPEYRKRRVAELQKQPAAAQAPQRPSSVPPNAVWNPQGNNGGGAWQLPQ